MQETSLNLKLRDCFRSTYGWDVFCENHIASRFQKSLPDLFGVFKCLSFRIECKMIKLAKIKSKRYLITKREKTRPSGLTTAQKDKINELHEHTDATFVCYHKYIKARDKQNGLYLIPSREIFKDEEGKIEDFLSSKPKFDWEQYWVPCKRGVGFDIKEVFEREMKLHLKKMKRLWVK